MQFSNLLFTGIYFQKNNLWVLFLSTYLMLDTDPDVLSQNWIQSALKVLPKPTYFSTFKIRSNNFFFKKNINIKFKKSVSNLSYEKKLNFIDQKVRISKKLRSGSFKRKLYLASEMKWQGSASWVITRTVRYLYFICMYIYFILFY